ncbi:EGF-like domain protein [Necator americanus]|uniref:EGF-like domain protein n=1 Tax=Necator americanus TaxID=51031 RepID=W2T799_NECAM|nr:EGF-like domain protein [Necator americanus]ETN77509.1 EGF-like domain protein [Necator americanus]
MLRLNLVNANQFVILDSSELLNPSKFRCEGSLGLIFEHRLPIFSFHCFEAKAEWFNQFLSETSPLDSVAFCKGHLSEKKVKNLHKTALTKIKQAGADVQAVYVGLCPCNCSSYCSSNANFLPRTCLSNVAFEIVFLNSTTSSSPKVSTAAEKENTATERKSTETEKKLPFLSSGTHVPIQETSKISQETFTPTQETDQTTTTSLPVHGQGVSFKSTTHTPRSKTTFLNFPDPYTSTTLQTVRTTDSQRDSSTSTKYQTKFTHNYAEIIATTMSRNLDTSFVMLNTSDAETIKIPFASSEVSVKTRTSPLSKLTILSTTENDKSADNEFLSPADSGTSTSHSNIHGQEDTTTVEKLAKITKELTETADYGFTTLQSSADAYIKVSGTSTPQRSSITYNQEDLTTVEELPRSTEETSYTFKSITFDALSDSFATIASSTGDEEGSVHGFERTLESTRVRQKSIETTMSEESISTSMFNYSSSESTIFSNVSMAMTRAGESETSTASLVSVSGISDHESSDHQLTSGSSHRTSTTKILLKQTTVLHEDSSAQANQEPEISMSLEKESSTGGHISRSASETQEVSYSSTKRTEGKYSKNEFLLYTDIDTGTSSGISEEYNNTSKYKSTPKKKGSSESIGPPELSETRSNIKVVTSTTAYESFSTASGSAGSSETVKPSEKQSGIRTTIGTNKYQDTFPANNSTESTGAAKLNETRSNTEAAVSITKNQRTHTTNNNDGRVEADQDTESSRFTSPAVFTSSRKKFLTDVSSEIINTVKADFETTSDKLEIPDIPYNASSTTLSKQFPSKPTTREVALFSSSTWSSSKAKSDLPPTSTPLVLLNWTSALVRERHSTKFFESSSASQPNATLFGNKIETLASKLTSAATNAKSGNTTPAYHTFNELSTLSLANADNLEIGESTELFKTNKKPSFDIVYRTTLATETSTGQSEDCKAPCLCSYEEGSEYCYRILSSLDSSTYRKALKNCQSDDDSDLADERDFGDPEVVKLIRTRSPSTILFFVNEHDSEMIKKNRTVRIVSIEGSTNFALAVNRTAGLSETIEDVNALCRKTKYCNEMQCNLDDFVFYGISTKLILPSNYKKLDIGQNSDGKELKDAEVPMNNEIRKSCDECNQIGTDRCEEVEGGFMCFCKPNWSGAVCWISPNQCEIQQLQCGHNGTCFSEVDRAYCWCDEGYAGVHCEVSKANLSLLGPAEGSVDAAVTGSAVALSTTEILLMVGKGLLLLYCPKEGQDTQVFYQNLRSLVISVAGLVVLLFHHPGLLNISPFYCSLWFCMVTILYSLGIGFFALEARNVYEVAQVKKRNSWDDFLGRTAFGAPKIALPTLLVSIVLGGGIIAAVAAHLDQLYSICVWNAMKLLPSKWSPSHDPVLMWKKSEVLEQRRLRKEGKLQVEKRAEDQMRTYATTPAHKVKSRDFQTVYSRELDEEHIHLYSSGVNEQVSFLFWTWAMQTSRKDPQSEPVKRRVRGAEVGNHEFDAD